MKKITKIICFIDNLNAGGAQRQICQLAVMLKKKNFDVCVLTYNNQNFFLNELKKNNIKHICFNYKSKILKIIKLVKYLNSSQKDLIITYLRNPSVIAEVASIFRKKWKLIVSERNNYFDENFLISIFRRFLHLFADHVIVNSDTNYKLIKKNAPWIKNVSLIHNFTDLKTFKPNTDVSYQFKNKNNFIAIGKYSNQKNILNLVEAIKIVRERDPEINFTLNWYGENFEEKKSYSYISEVKKQIKKYKLDRYFILNSSTQNILKKYHSSTALILPSFYEGFSNVVSEAIACGLPIMLSDVCDNKLFVDNRNGYLFNPYDPYDIAEKIIRFCKLSKGDYIIMSKNSRKKAETLFDEDKFFRSHLQIIKNIYN